MVSQLLLLAAVQLPLPDVERTVFLTQIVERLSVSIPHGVAVFTAEGGQTRELSVALAAACLFHQPNVTGDGTLMVLTECIFVSLAVVVEQTALWMDADVLHRDE